MSTFGKKINFGDYANTLVTGPLNLTVKGDDISHSKLIVTRVLTYENVAPMVSQWIVDDEAQAIVQAQKAKMDAGLCEAVYVNWNYMTVYKV